MSPAATIAVAGHEAPFGIDLLFAAAGSAGFTFHVEICEDLWVPQPPSTAGALAGAEILLNLSASNITIGKAQMRRLLCASQSARCIAAYAYSAAGAGELTTDLAWDGQAGIFEFGDGLAETERFSDSPEMAVADVDLGRIRQERMRTNTFGDCARATAGPRARRSARSPSTFRRRTAAGPAPQCRALSVCAGRPGDAARELLRGLQHPGPRAGAAAAATGLKKLVIGVSGGLDSTQALIVAARTMDRLGLPRTEHAGLHACPASRRARAPRPTPGG